MVTQNEKHTIPLLKNINFKEWHSNVALREHVKHFYGINEHNFIGQLLFWSSTHAGIDFDQKRWIYNTGEQWAESLKMSRNSFVRLVKNLREAGILLVKKLAKNKRDRTNYYCLNQDFLNSLKEKVKELRGNVACCVDRIKNHASVPVKAMSAMVGAMVGAMNINRLHRHHKSNKSEKRSESLEGEKKMEGNGLPNDLVKQMVNTWHKHVSSKKGLPMPTLNVYLSGYLVACFQNKFDRDMKKWENYCRFIASSSYLMGKDFSISPGWATKYPVIDRILSGELGVNLNILALTQDTSADCEIRAAEHISGLSEGCVAKDARKAVLDALGSREYMSWFKDISVSEDGISFKAPNRFVADTIENRFGYVLKSLGKEITYDNG